MNKYKLILTAALLIVSLFVVATMVPSQQARIKSAEWTKGQEKDPGSEDLKREIEKVTAERQRRAQREAEVLKSFSERLRPQLKEAAAKTGFDVKAAEAEMRAVADETNRDRQRELADAYRQKYEPQFNKLIQASGINVAQERQKLIAALGLDPAKIKPSNSLTLEIKRDPVSAAPVEAPPDERLRHHPVRRLMPQDQSVAVAPPLTRPQTWGDGATSYNEFRGSVDAFTRSVWVADESIAGSMLHSRFDVGNGITRVRVKAEVSEFHYVGSLAGYGYSSAESFTGVYVTCDSILVFHQGISLARVISPVFGSIGIWHTGSQSIDGEFDLRGPRRCWVGFSAEGIAGAGGPANAVANTRVTLQKASILGWKQ